MSLCCVYRTQGCAWDGTRSKGSVHNRIQVPEPPEDTLGSSTQHTSHTVDGLQEKRQEKWILGTFRSSFDLWDPSFNWKAPIAPKASSNSPQLSYNFKKTEALSGSGAREETFGEQARTKTGIRRMPDTARSISFLGPVRNKRLAQGTQLSCAERERDTCPLSSLCEILGFSTYVDLCMDSHADISQGQGSPCSSSCRQ